MTFCTYIYIYIIRVCVCSWIDFKRENNFKKKQKEKKTIINRHIFSFC